MKCVAMSAVASILIGCVGAPDINCNYVNPPTDAVAVASNADADGFVSLFNGKDLTGWIGATKTYGVDPEEPGVL